MKVCTRENFRNTYRSANLRCLNKICDLKGKMRNKIRVELTKYCHTSGYFLTAMYDDEAVILTVIRRVPEIDYYYYDWDRSIMLW